MLRSNVIPLTVCSALIALSAACSGGSHAPSSNGARATTAAAQAQAVKGAVDPCKVLTSADAAAAAGAPVEAAKLTPAQAPLGLTLCDYASPASSTIYGVQLSVVQTQGMVSELRGRGYDARKLFEDGKAIYPNRQDVPGVGDEAFIHGQDIDVVQGNTQFSVNFGIGTDNVQGNEAARLIDLAKTLSSRLPR
jgi:hypothetical protein